jgi:hypothetical protein
LISDNESTISAEDEQLVPVVPIASSKIHSKSIFDETSGNFTFSSLMKQMAQKYQDNNSIDDK